MRRAFSKRSWWLNGTHYARTSRAWLDRMDAHRAAILSSFSSPTAYGEEAGVWFRRWRVFYIAVEEMFAFSGGNEWGVSHYLFEKPKGKN